MGTKAATILFGNFGKTLVGVGMAVSIFGALNGCVMVFPRSYYAMAKDGLFLPSFRKLHPTYKTPVSALIASMIVSSALVCTRNLKPNHLSCGVQRLYLQLPDHSMQLWCCAKSIPT